MASSSSSPSQSAELNYARYTSCVQQIDDIKSQIKDFGQDISMECDLSEETKAKIIGCLDMLTKQFEQEYASIPSIKFDEFFEPIRNVIYDHIPEFFEDHWTCWITQMDDLCEYQKKKMIQFMIERMKGTIGSITPKKQEILKEFWEENTKRYKELVSEFGRLTDPIIEKVKTLFKAFKVNLVQHKKFIEQNKILEEKAKSKKRKFGKNSVSTIKKLARSPTAMKALVEVLPDFGGGASSSSGDYGTNLSYELPEYFDVVVREFWPRASDCFLFMIKSNLESKGFFKTMTFQGAAKNPSMLKHLLQYELIQNPENAELKTMYRFQCEDTKDDISKPSQDEDDDDAPLNLAASASSTIDSLPSLGGLGFESRNNSENTADKIAAEAKRPNDVADTQEQSIGDTQEQLIESDEDDGSENEKSDEDAAEDEENE